MQRFAAVSDSALALTSQLLGSDVKSGFIAGVVIALTFVFGP